MGKTVAVYDTKNLSFTINGAEHSLDLGEGVVEIDGSDSIDMRTSGGGVPLFSRKKEALHRKIKFPVMKQSSLNAKLSGLEAGGTYFSFSMVDLNTDDSYVSAKCILTKPASPKLGDNSDLEWEFIATYMQPTVVGRDT